MKKNKLQRTVFIFLVSMSFAFCVQDGDFSVPENLGLEENKKLDLLLDSINKGFVELKSLRDLKKLYISGTNPLQIVSDIVVKGYVISSDENGNFFREFYMQDQPENPTTGIKVIVNTTNIHTKYNFGREVYIRLKGMYLGETNSGDGLTTIGGNIKLADAREIENISLNQTENHIYRSKTTAVIVPKLATLASIYGTESLCTFVQIENAFFAGNLEGKAYIDPAEDFDTKRVIQTCEGLGVVASFVETSSFANFANLALPKGGGTIDAVVSKDFGGDFVVLVLNKSEDVQMDGTKCTPKLITDYTTLLLAEDFETTSGNISISGWTNFSETGTKLWRSYLDTDVSSRAANVGSYRSGNSATLSWLITRGVNLEQTTEEYLSFETSTSFADGSSLEVLISEDWNGNQATITTANWQTLPVRIASNTDDFATFIHSTYVSLSNYSGTVYIAFKYIGNGNEDFDGSYELDNIRILAN